jgi:dTDP-4-dehydrorhamnose reductase
MVFADRNEVSLDNLSVLKKSIRIQPNVILNCGAYTAWIKQSGNRIS